MSRWYVLPVLGLLLLAACKPGERTGGETEADSLAGRPPMGWNSWNSFGVDVTEAEFRQNVDFMADQLKEYGWEYAVVDLGWYQGDSVTIENFKADRPDQRIDRYGRLIPAENRFPSAQNGSFKAMADYAHRKGLKFGIHIMRGIPWQAVEANTPILGTKYRARDVAALQDTCVWYDGMVGVDVSKPGGQEYYNSLARLYASWGVDFVKADDMSRPYHRDEIEALSRALKASGRDIVLSLSPGETPLADSAHVATYAHMWRISGDFWDAWHLLKAQFDLLKAWEGRARPGQWPDADMLPLGRLRKHGPDDYVVEKFNETAPRPLTAMDITNENSRFTNPEKQTLMTLWSITRSPLMFGGHLPETDGFTLSLITNPEALAVSQNSANNREVFRRGPAIGWAADVPGSTDRYVALFNVGDRAVLRVTVDWKTLGLSGAATVRDLWAQTDLGTHTGSFSAGLAPHSSGLYRISPAR